MVVFNYLLYIYYFRENSTISNNQIPEEISNKEIIKLISGVNYTDDKEKHVEHIFDNDLNAVTTDINTSATEENKLNVSFCMFISNV